jgi:hypothetical protein
MRAEIVDSLEWVYPDSVVADRPGRSLSVDVPRGGIASFHIVLNDVPVGATLRLSARRGGRTTDQGEWFVLHDVPVEINTGPVGFVEKRGERNRYVTRRAPFRVFDAMEPVRSRIKAPSETVALRVQFPVARNAKAGKRTYEIEMTARRETKTLRPIVNVYSPVIPPAGKDSFPYTNWFGVERMAARHGLEMWSDAHWRMIRKYARMMLHARQNVFWCPLRYVFEMKKGAAILNCERLRRYVRTFTAEGLHYILGGHFARRPRGTWNDPKFELRLTGSGSTSVEGNIDLARIAGQLMCEIERNGWQDRWIQHVADEPNDANASEYRILCGIVRKYLPGIPLLDATLDRSLVGSVDIWCPQGQRYQTHRKQFEDFRKAGDKVWFYTCCFPGGRWLNRLLDMELLRPTLMGWYGGLYDLDGYLHWGLNQYPNEQHPFNRSIVRARTAGAHLPAGDTHIVYPGKNGPWSSLRLEAQREGLEDYELLKLLRARSPKRADAIIRRVVRGFGSYTKDVKTFRSARRALLRTLS